MKRSAGRKNNPLRCPAIILTPARRGGRRRIRQIAIGNIAIEVSTRYSNALHFPVSIGDRTGGEVVSPIFPRDFNFVPSFLLDHHHHHSRLRRSRGYFETHTPVEEHGLSEVSKSESRRYQDREQRADLELGSVGLGRSSCSR